MIAPQKKYQILLVEDNLAQAKLFLEAVELAQENVNVKIISDSEAVMVYLKNDFLKIMPDLIFLDLHLQKKSGFNVLKEIKEDPKLKEIPVVILTSSNRERDIQEAYALQANCFIQKPLDFDEFANVIQSIEKFWFRPYKNPPIQRSVTLSHITN